MARDLPDDVLALLSVLRRRPDVEAPELVAVDAADRLVLAEARELLASAAPGEVAVVDDGYGALCLGALALGAPDVRVSTDTVTSERAILLNAAAVLSPDRQGPRAQSDGQVPLASGAPGAAEHDAAAQHDAAARRDVAAQRDGRTPTVSYASATIAPSAATPQLLSRLSVHPPLTPDAVEGARVVLARLPRSLDALAELADLVADHAAPDVVLWATGRLKHMSHAMNDVLADRFEEVSATLASGKSRVLVARGPRPAGPGHVSFPRRARVDGGLDVVAHGAAFAGATVDIGTRVLLGVLDELVAARKASGAPLEKLLDLGCGTGLLASAVSVRVPGADVVATDRSAAAVLSAAATAAANGVEDRVLTLRDDAAASVPDASVDVVVCNPPFHAGAVVSVDIAEAMFRAAARVLRPGGELWVVWNSHLRYRAALERSVGPTEQITRTPKFTVTRSRRSPDHRRPAPPGLGSR